jgi:hypothetical protein
MLRRLIFFIFIIAILEPSLGQEAQFTNALLEVIKSDDIFQRVAINIQGKRHVFLDGATRKFPMLPETLKQMNISSSSTSLFFEDTLVVMYTFTDPFLVEFFCKCSVTFIHIKRYKVKGDRAKLVFLVKRTISSGAVTPLFRINAHRRSSASGWKVLSAKHR